MDEQDYLNKFGKILTEHVRDYSYRKLEKIISGDYNIESLETIHKGISTLDKNQLEIIKKLVLEMIDTTVHNFLWMIEEEEIDLIMKDDEKKQIIKLNEISDGLYGESYGEDGWVKKFSKYGPILE